MVVTQFYLVLRGSGGLRAALNERRTWFNDGGRDWRRKTNVPSWNWLNDERRNAIVRHPKVGAFATNWKSRAVLSGRLNGNSDVQEEIWLLVSDDARWEMPTRTIGRGRAQNRFIQYDSNTSSRTIGRRSVSNGFIPQYDSNTSSRFPVLRTCVVAVSLNCRKNTYLEF